MNLNALKKMLDHTSRRSDYYLFYSLSFLLTAAAVFSWYLFSGKTLIWSQDGWNQHFKALVYYGRYLRKIIKTLFLEHRLSLPAWDPFIGEGSDILSTLHYYVIGDPLCLPAVLVRSEYMHYMYSALIILRLYLAGISFSVLCFKRGLTNRWGIFAGAISYCFCYWALLNAARHPYFLNPMIWFPLIIAGIEDVLRQRRSYLLTAAVFLSAVSNFYFFYIIVLLTVIYTAVRTTLKYGRRWKNYIRPVTTISLASLCGTMIAGLILLPVLHSFLVDSRMGIDRPWHLFYPLKYYSLLPSLLTNPAGEEYYWVCLCFSAPVLLSMGFLFVKERKRPEDRLFKILLAISLLILMIPALGQFINGMSYMSNRWCWGLALLCCFLLSSQWDRLLLMEKSEAVKLFFIFCFYTCICLFFERSRNIVSYFNICLTLILLFGLVYVLKEKRHRQYAMTAMTLVSVISCSFWKNSDSYKAYKYSAEVMDFRKVNESFWQNETEAVLFLVGNTPEKNRYIRCSGRDLTFNANIFKGLSSSNYFWSISNPAITDFRSDLEMTESIPQEYQGYDDRSDLLALSSTNYFTVKDTDSLAIPYGFSLLGSVNVQAERTEQYLNALSRMNGGTLTPSQEEMIYQKSDEVYRVYKNNYALPLGYVYDHFMTPDTWEHLSALERQETMLSSVCLSEPSRFCQETVLPSRESVIDYQADTPKTDIYFKDNVIVTTADNQKLTLTFKGLENAETYVELKGLHYTASSTYDLYFGSDDKDPDNLYNQVTWDMLSIQEQFGIIRNHLLWISPQAVDLTFSTKIDQEEAGTKDQGKEDSPASISTDADSPEGPSRLSDAEKNKTDDTSDKAPGAADSKKQHTQKKDINYCTPDYNFYGGRKDFLINMGYSKEPLTSVTLTFPSMGIYSLDSLKILCRPMQDFGSSIMKLKSRSLDNVSFGTDRIQGDMNLERPGILCVTVPYSEGWHAFVDGKEQKVLTANKHYLGLDLDRGNHHIVLTYTRPLQKAGCYLSLAGVLLFAVIVFFEEKKRKKNYRHKKRSTA